MTVEEIAAKLAAEEREAMLAGHWSSRQGKGLERAGLVYRGAGPHGRPMIKFRPLGFAVREYLKGQP